MERKQLEQYDYIIESYNNGQFTQVKDLFKRIRGVDNKLELVTYVKRDEILSIEGKLDLVAFLLKKMIDRG